MQSRRRRGDGALTACEHGLVIIAVPRVCGAAEIGRQRHGAVALQRLGERRAAPIEDQAHLRPDPRLDRGRELVGKGNPVPWPEPPRGLGECQPAVVRDAPVQGELYLRFAPPARKARRDYPRVVEDHRVARLQQGREIRDTAVGEARSQVQQAR